jgi:hypothetical protein
MNTLMTQILEILYQDPAIRRLWKDQLSDWILDQQASEQPLDARALLNHMLMSHPEVLERLVNNVRVKDRIQAFLRPAAQRR